MAQFQLTKGKNGPFREFFPFNCLCHSLFGHFWVHLGLHNLCDITYVRNQYFKGDPIKVTGIMGIVASRSRLRLYTLMISFGHGFQLKKFSKNLFKNFFKNFSSKIFAQKFEKTFSLQKSKKISKKNLKSKKDFSQ